MTKSKSSPGACPDDVRTPASSQIVLFGVNADGSCRCSKGAACPDKGKHPKGGPWEPGDHLGNLTGEEHGRIVVDVDVKRDVDGYAQLEELETRLGALPQTFTVRTPSKGAHLYFQHPGFRVSNASLVKGIDVRGDADVWAYVVAPGSAGYEVAVDAPMAELPDVWKAHFLTRTSSGKKTGEPVTPIDPTHAKWEERIALGVKACKTYKPSRADGNASSSIYRLGCRLMLGLRLPIETALELVVEHFNPRCTCVDGVTPYPWEPGDILRVLENASREADGAIREIVDLSGLKAHAKAASELALDPERARAEGANCVAWTFERGDSVEIADKLREVVPGLVFTEGEFFLYDEASGVWSSDGLEKRLKALVRSMAGAPIGEKCILKLNYPGIEHAIKTLADAVEDRDFFAKAASGLACSNGFLRLTDAGVELVPHSPDHRARVPYPRAWEEGASSERWTTFLHELFVDDHDAEQKKHCLGEFFGASLFGIATKYQKCLVAPGEGDNGKSTLIEIMSAMFPKGTVGALSPQKFENEYWRARLPGLLLNAVSDLPSATILASEAFKSIVTGNEIDGREPTKPVIFFHPRAGHIYAANNLPSTADQSHGFWRRYLVVQFNRRFADKGEKGIQDKILTECGEAIFAWMVAGAVRLHSQKNYTVPESSADALKRWRQESDSVATWLEERAVKVDEPRTGMRVLYKDYNAWAKDGGYKPVAENVFGKRLATKGWPREGKGKLVRLAVPTPLPVAPLRQSA